MPRTKRRAAKAHPPEPEPLFYPFDLSPPPAAACLDAVYDVFAEYGIGEPFCRQCFTPEQEKAMRLQRDLRRADAALFDLIYFEHPNCSGGISTFFHWLPRGLELSFFDDRFLQPLYCQMARVGISALPERQMHALRQLFCRVALNWLNDVDAAPLGVIPKTDDAFLVDAYRDTMASGIFAVLILLRVDLSSVLPLLVENGRKDIWSFLIDLRSSGPSFLDDGTYYVLENEEDIPALRDAVAALQRRASDDVFRFVGEETMLDKWLDLDEDQPMAAERLAVLEARFEEFCRLQTDEERVADERLMVIGFKLDAAEV